MEHILIARDEVVREGKFVEGRHMVRAMKAIDANSHAGLLENVPLDQMNDSSFDAFLSTEDIGNGITVKDQSVVRIAALVENREGVSTNDLEHNVQSCYGDPVTLSSVKADLASKRTVKAVLDYAYALNKSQLEGWKDSDDYDLNGTHPIAEELASALFDGQPCNQGAHLIAEDMRKEKPEWGGKVQCFFGAFHTLLKLYNTMGDLFANIFPT